LPVSVLMLPMMVDFFARYIWSTYVCAVALLYFKYEWFAQRFTWDVNFRLL